MAGITQRPWFRFRLRTLLFAITAVGLVLGWVGWNANIARKRSQTLSELRLRKEERFVHVFSPSDVKKWDLPPRTATVSMLRTWFGDRAIGVIRFQHDAPQSELDYVAYLFPEAVVDRWADPNEFLKLLDKRRK